MIVGRLYKFKKFDCKSSFLILAIREGQYYDEYLIDFLENNKTELYIFKNQHFTKEEFLNMFIELKK